MATRNRWFRISLRAVLLIFTCIAVALGWLSYRAQQRRLAFAAIRKAGGDIQFAIREPTLVEEWFWKELFVSVNKVDLRQGRVDDKLLAHIGVLSELRRLDMSHAEIGDEALQHISHLPLRELWLQDTEITDASATTLSKIEDLNFLQLNATSVSDAFLKKLGPLPHLENLGLRGTQVSGLGLNYLSRHPKLKQLDVYSTGVDDTGVQHLAECQSLTFLGLSSTNVTDNVFQHLTKFPNLTNVDLTANRPITSDSVAAFKDTSPRCVIQW